LTLAYSEDVKVVLGSDGLNPVAVQNGAAKSDAVQRG
jgi:hypothetical protein